MQGGEAEKSGVWSVRYGACGTWLCGADCRSCRWMKVLFGVQHHLGSIASEVPVLELAHVRILSGFVEAVQLQQGLPFIP